MYDNIENISCDVLCGLVPFVRFKKSENTHGRVLLLVKLQVSAATLLKVTPTPPWVFSRFLNRTNDTKSRNASQILSS